MAENTTTQEAPAAPPVVVGQAEHNGVTVDLVWQNPRRVPKGEIAIPYVAPNFDAITDEQLITLFGAKEVRKKLISAGLARCKGFFGEACSGPDDAPVWDETKSLAEYQQMFADWSARGDTIGELKAELVETAERLFNLAMEGKMEEAKALAKDMQQLKKDIAAKKRKPKGETAEVEVAGQEA